MRSSYLTPERIVRDTHFQSAICTRCVANTTRHLWLPGAGGIAHGGTGDTQDRSRGIGCRSGAWRMRGGNHRRRRPLDRLLSGRPRNHPLSLLPSPNLPSRKRRRRLSPSRPTSRKRNSLIRPEAPPAQRAGCQSRRFPRGRPSGWMGLQSAALAVAEAVWRRLPRR